ncbi:uncharacterized protein LOC134427959 isoform X4 [Melospiza melodia melodia]|uniref:uncharacterized protein LOC134427959 isoform X4 n=1 Tax=Melospiza melodia melodia TaxID=1914991 RepID=UPI002FD15CD0
MIKGKRQVFGIYFRGFLRASQLVFCPPSPPAPERGSSAAPPHRQPRGGGHYASLPRRRRDRDLGSGSAGTRSGVPRWRHQGREKGAARPVPRTGCWAPRGRSGGIVREQGRRWTQPSAWKWISPAERSGRATREQQGEVALSWRFQELGVDMRACSSRLPQDPRAAHTQSVQVRSYCNLQTARQMPREQLRKVAQKQ